MSSSDVCSLARSAPDYARAVSEGRLKPTTLVLVDDNRLLRAGLAVLLSSQPSFKVLAALDVSDAALKAVQLAKPDVLVIDAELGLGDPLKLVDAVRKEVPLARVVVMGVQHNYCDVAKYLRAGVLGFILNDNSFDELSETIRCVAAGCQVLPPPILAVLAEQRDSGDETTPMATTLEAAQLTGREQEVVELLAEGLNNKAIAGRLDIAVHTVKSHVHHVLEKLALHSRLEVAAYAHSHHPPEAR